MEKALRNTLRLQVIRCRKLLEVALTETLEGQFGIHPDGAVEPAARLAHLAPVEHEQRAQIVQVLRHRSGNAAITPFAVLQLARVVAFTHLNRLCAFKMAERRHIVRETVTRGLQARGFQLFLAQDDTANALMERSEPWRAYRGFLAAQGELLAREVPALFLATDPANWIYPADRAFAELIDLINDEKIDAVWDGDETLGWIYQYFTPQELRDDARKASAAPRDSYELSFRNQFYTPHYVVEFLTDNTLGRMWYEMRQGHTRLTEQCRYLMHQRDEPAHMPARAKRDPRELAVLDPACGSGHFLLYAFDLLLTIYAEAWEDDEIGPLLRRDYHDAAAYRSAVPALILAHNLAGIDIDPRATQIAALALWLRAQRAYGEAGIDTAQRPPLPAAQIACASAMPREQPLRLQLLNHLDPPILSEIVAPLWETLTLAADMGSLLKPDATLHAAIDTAKQQWLHHRYVNLTLFSEHTPPEQIALSYTGVSDVQFFETEALPRALAALRQLADTRPADDITPALFADDATQGLGFVDLLLRRYDVVLMNPPFGAPSLPAKSAIEKLYPRTKNDLFAAFVERGLALLKPGGRLGAITSRTGFFLTSFQKWREEILLGEARVVALADLGAGVLDSAMVETAAYVLEKSG